MNQFLKTPNDDFAAVRDGRKSMPLWLDIDLSTARSIAAGTAQILNIAGNSIYSDQNVLQGVGTLHFQDTSLGMSSAPITINPGFIANVPFTQIMIENAAQPGLRMRVFYGVDIDFQPGTGGLVNVTGSVAVINGERDRVGANKCFIGISSNTGAAGNYSMAQLWNPAGSGKNLIVNKMSIYTANAASTGIGICRHNAALPTLSGNGASKLIGPGVVSQGELRNTNNASIIGTVMASFANQSVNESKEFQFSEPLIIQPGNGVIVFSVALNTNLQTTFQWNEEPI